MITIDELKNGLFMSEYFTNEGHSCDIIEKQNKDVAGTLYKVHVTTTGNIIKISNAFLHDDTPNAFRKIHGEFSFKKDSDGIFIINKDGKQYFVLIELKSGYKDVERKAFYQIIASYMKMRIMFSSFPSSVCEPGKEIAVIVSYPYDSGTCDGDILPEKEMTIFEGIDTPMNRIRHDIRAKGNTVITATDFGLDTMAINKSVLFDNLKVVHIPAKLKSTDTVIDLDVVLNRL